MVGTLGLSVPTQLCAHFIHDLYLHTLPAKIKRNSLTNETFRHLYIAAAMMRFDHTLFLAHYACAQYEHACQVQNFILHTRMLPSHVNQMANSRLLKVGVHTRTETLK